MMLDLSGYWLVPLATLKAARCWAPTALQQQQNNHLEYKCFGRLDVLLIQMSDSITLNLPVLQENQAVLAVPPVPDPRFDLVYQRFPPSRAPPSLPSRGQDHHPKVLLQTAATLATGGYS